MNTLSTFRAKYCFVNGYSQNSVVDFSKILGTVHDFLESVGNGPNFFPSPDSLGRYDFQTTDKLQPERVPDGDVLKLDIFLKIKIH